MNLFFGTVLVAVLYLLFWYGLATMSNPEFVSCLALVLIGWAFEVKALKRDTIDFSSGFVFPLILIMQGSEIAACLAVVGALCVRFLTNKTRLVDVLSLVAPALLALTLQLSDNWPEEAIFRVFLGLGLLAVWKFSFFLLAMSVFQKLASAQAKRKLLEERELSRLRNVLASYSLLGSVLEQSQGWIAVLGFPLCGAVVSGAENVVFRIRAFQTEKVRRDATQVGVELRQKRAVLEGTVRKHRLLDEISRTFARSLPPEKTLESLRLLLKKITEVDSVKLVDFRPDKIVSEPLVLKAWSQSKPTRGVASPRIEERIVSGEDSVVALPVRPLGVIYVGRRGARAFSKSEAGRLWFAVQRATPALLRTNQQAQTEETLKNQAQLSSQLREKVTLSSKLLEASGFLLASLTQEQVLKTFETVLKSSISHQAGIVLLGKNDEPVWSWGDLDPTGDLDEVTSPTEIAFRDDLQNSSLGTLLPTCDCVMGLPLKGEGAFLGAVLLGFTASQRPGQEQIEFLATCAGLVGASLNALRLMKEVREAEQRVSQANKMGAIGQLAAGVAHELNTPLATIALAVEAARARPEKAEQRLARATEAIGRAKQIVNQLLAHSRYGEGERVLLDPETTLRTVAQLAESHLSKRRQRVKLETEEVSDKILADANDLTQVFLNLILNASDASPDGAPITLYMKQQGNLIVLGVHDQGQGIEEETKSKVFQPFFTTKPLGKGTGLGLSVCRQLVKRHAGKIRFESEPGKGTTFILEFPARVEAKHLLT